MFLVCVYVLMCLSMHKYVRTCTLRCVCVCVCVCVVLCCVVLCICVCVGTTDLVSFLRAVTSNIYDRGLEMQV